MTVFWGISVSNGNPVTVNFRNAPRKRLRVTQATMRDTLDLPSGDIEPNTELHCKVGDQQPHTICSLGKHAYMWKFDLEFEGPEEVEFSVSGTRVIDVAGYFFEDARPINIMFSQLDVPTQREVVTPGEQSMVLLGPRNDHQKEAIDSTYKEKQGSCVEGVSDDISELDRVITSIGKRVMADEFGRYRPILGSLRLARDDELAAEFMKAKDRLCFGSGSMGSELSCLPATALELVRNPDVGLANPNVAVICANTMIPQSEVTPQKLVDTATDSTVSGKQTTSAVEGSSKISASKACEDSLTINACVDCEHDHDSDKDMVHGLSKDTGAELLKQEKLTPADEVTMQSEGIASANYEDKVVTSCSNEPTEIIHNKPQVDGDDCVEPNHVSMVVEDQMPIPKKKRKRTKKSSNVEGSIESEMHEQTVLIDRHDDCLEPNKSVVMEDQMLKPKKKKTISKESSSVPGSTELSVDTIQACNQWSEDQMVEQAIPVDKDETNVSVAVENQMLKPKKKKKKAKESSSAPDSMELSYDSFHACNQQNETEMAKQVPVDKDETNVSVAVENQMLKPKKKKKKAKESSSAPDSMELSYDSFHACNQQNETEMAKQVPVDKDEPNVSVAVENQMLKPKKKKKKAKETLSAPGNMQCSETEIVEEAIPVDKDEPNVSLDVEDQVLKPKKKKKKSKDSSSVPGNLQCSETEMVEEAIPVDKDEPIVSLDVEDQMLKPKKKKKKAKHSSSVPGSMQCSETEMVEQAIPLDKDEPIVPLDVEDQMLKPKKKKKKAKDSSSVPGSMQCSETEMVEQAIPLNKDEPIVSVVVEDQMPKPKKKKKNIKESSSVPGSMQCSETEMIEQVIPVDRDECVEPSNFPLVVEDQMPKPMKKRIRTKQSSSVGGSIESDEMIEQTIVERDVCVEPNVSVVEDEMLKPKKKKRKTKESSSVGGGVELSDVANHELACKQRSDSEMVEQANPVDGNCDVDLSKKQDPVTAGHMIVCALTVQPFSIQPPSATPVRKSPIRRSMRSSTK